MQDRNRLSRIDIRSMRIDPRVQRPLDHTWVNKLAADFRPESVGALVVSARSDGTVIVIDGQHRHAAGLKAGFTGKLPCVVYEDLELADEAALFLTLNNSRKVQAIDRFRVRVIEGDKAAAQMNDILREYQWEVRNAASPRCFSAVTALEKVYDGATVSKKGERDDLVRFAISVITCSWGYDYSGAHAAIVGGLGHLAARYGNKIDTGRLTGILAKHRPVHLVASAKQRADNESITASAGMAAVMHGLYNKGLRSSRLPVWINR